MIWTLHYDDWPNCCPFHQRFQDVMSNSMPCGEVLWGQGFTIEVDGKHYDVWGNEVKSFEAEGGIQ